MKKTNWYKNSIGYIIYPSSYYDTNDDGIGDLPGIIKKLDYLAWLGVDLIWICPIFKSPMDDYGYDVSDFEHVNPLFGKDEDLINLLNEAHKRGIHIVLDLVLNHTSDEHPWFKKAITNPNSEEYGYYIFKDKPNNWSGFFNTSTWEYVPSLDKYFFHCFSKTMPDLNWANPHLREEIYKVARKYLDLGVDGFRLDAVAHLAKDMTFEDIKGPVDKDGLAFDPSKFSNREEVYKYLNLLNENVFSKYDIVTVGEVGGSVQPKESLRYNNKENGPIDLVFNFDTAWCNGAYGSIDKSDEEIRTDVMCLKNGFLRWYKNCYKDAKGLAIYWNNHDHPRCLSQYGSVQYRNESGKMLITVLLFLYGVPFIHYGDEIGMSNTTYKELEDFKDVSAQNYLKSYGHLYPKEQLLRFENRTSRVSGRTPMQWEDSLYAGFSHHEPHLKINDNYHEVNVASNMKNEHSILNYYRRAIKIRKEEDISSFVHDEYFSYIDMLNEDVFAYSHGPNQELVCIANFRNHDVSFPFDKSSYDILLHNYESVESDDILRPFECYLLRKKH